LIPLDEQGGDLFDDGHSTPVQAVDMPVPQDVNLSSIESGVRILTW
jgi:hypothetical protein